MKEIGKGGSSNGGTSGTSAATAEAHGAKIPGGSSGGAAVIHQAVIHQGHGGGGRVEKGGQVANSAAHKQALEETSEEPGGGARSVVPRAVGREGLTSIPNSDFGCSMLLSSEGSSKDRVQAVAAVIHSNIAVDENLGDTPQREQSKKVHEASARSATRSPTRLL